MKWKILSETRGRIRVQLIQPRMTLDQADLLEAWLAQQDGVLHALVHERTCCAVLTYEGGRAALLARLARFHWDSAAEAVPAPAHTGRAINREYQERLVDMTAARLFRRLFFPAPLRAAVTIVCFAICVWIKSLITGSGSPDEVEAKIKEKEKKKFAESL